MSKETKRFANGAIALATHIEDAFAKQELYIRKYSYADVAVGAVLRRSVKLTKTISNLAKASCGVDALALSRSLIDYWIVLRWITNQDSETRGRLFWHFGAKQKQRMAEVVNIYRGPVGASVTLDPEIQRLASEYRRWDSWGPGSRAMADKRDTHS